MDKIRIKMIKTVRPDIPFLATDPKTILVIGEVYNAVANKNGAIAGICDNLKRLGVKPGEFEFVEAPEWLLSIWAAYSGEK